MLVVAQRAPRSSAVKFRLLALFVGMPIPLSAQVSASAGAELRLIEERYRSEDFGRTSDALDYSLMQRYMVHADVRAVSPTRRLTARLFTEVKSGLVAGRAVGLRVPDVDTADVQQAYGELTLAQPAGFAGTLRVGRQELVYGNQRLIGQRDFPNVRQAFDAARVMLKGGSAPWKVDVFVGSPVSTRVGLFDDATDHSKSLWGVYASRAWSGSSGNTMDVYYVGHHRDRAATHYASGAELRHTIGTRVSSRRVIRQGVMDAEVEPMLQFGTLASDKLRAWSVSAVSGWRWTRAATTPRLSLGVDASSGDHGASASARGSYHPLYATGGNMALGTPVGAVNFMSLHPKLETSLSRTLVLSGDWFITWRESTRDGLYNIAGSPITTPMTSRARFIGHRPGIHLDFAVNARMSIGARATYFMPGPYLRAIGWNRATEYATLTTLYRF